MTSLPTEWDLRTSGPGHADATVLCLSGALCSAVFYQDLMHEPSLTDVRLVAATLPGHAGTAPLADMGIENYARLAAELADHYDCAVVVGHSVGANVALEMAAAHWFSGPLVLLAPSLSRTDESMFPRVLDRLGGPLGRLPFSLTLKLMGPAMKGSLPPQRHDELVAELRKNDPRAMREHLRRYLSYLDRHGSVASRLCHSDVSAWVVYGENDDVGITDEELTVLTNCPTTEVVTLPDVGHFIANQAPSRVAEIVLAALAAA